MRLHPRILQIGADWGDGSHTKLYLVEGERKAIIDTGMPGNPSGEVTRYLDYFGLRLEDVGLILNTHGHHDHTGGNPETQRASGAPICLHEADAYMLEDPGHLFDNFQGRVMRLMGSRESEVAAARSRFVAELAPTQKVHGLLKDGDELDLGDGVVLRVVGLPGHSLGSVGYFWEQEGIMLAGDAIMGQGSRPGILPICYHPLVYRQTLQKMAGMSLRILALGHYYQGLTSASNPVKEGIELKRYLRDCEEIHNRVMEGMARARHEHWGEPYPVVLAAAVREISKHLWLRYDPATGMPPNAANSLAPFYAEMPE